MPRVNFVKKAQKDDPNYGIKKGDSYYWWKFRHGGVRKSKEPPRQSQLTQSDKKSRAYEAMERVEDALLAFELVHDLDQLNSEIEQASSDLNDVAQEYREAAEAIRENFSESPTADECEEKADNIEAYASDLDSLSLEEFDSDSGPSKDEWAEQIVNEVESAVGGLDL